MQRALVGLRLFTALIVGSGCGSDGSSSAAGEPAQSVEPSVEATADPGPAEARRVVGRLDVPAADIARARQEAQGLDRLGPTLRAQTLDRRRASAPSYEALRADPAGFAQESASFEGQVGLVRSAGEGLYLMALNTRRDGERWVDPLYVLTPLEPPFAADGGTEGRIDGWVVGARTIGRHTLPLVLAYHLETNPGDGS